jgi:hypothetical protein
MLEGFMVFIIREDDRVNLPFVRGKDATGTPGTYRAARVAITGVNIAQSGKNNSGRNGADSAEAWGMA